MTARILSHGCAGPSQHGKRLVAILLVGVGAACASSQGALEAPPRILRRPVLTEIHQGMTRGQVEDRVGLLLLREVIGETQVYVEPQTRCYYFFVRDFLREWSCS